MSLTKIGRKFTFVGTRAELDAVFSGTDVNVGDSAVILVVPEGATFDQRLAMATQAAAIRAADG